MRLEPSATFPISGVPAPGPSPSNQAISLDFLEEAAKARALTRTVLPLTAALDDIPALPVTPDQARLLRHGQRLSGFPAKPGLQPGDVGGNSGRSGRSLGRRPQGRPGVQPLRRTGVTRCRLPRSASRRSSRNMRRGKGDTGSPEVQVAILTERINNLTQHFKTPRQGQPFAPRPADAGQPAPLAARLSPSQGRAALHRPDRQARSPQIRKGRSGAFRISGGPAIRRPGFLQVYDQEQVPQFGGASWGHKAPRTAAGRLACTSCPRRHPAAGEGKQMFNTKTVEIEWGGKTLKLETGRVARQADGAVLATLGETVVLCAVTAAKIGQAGAGFLPADRPLPGKILRRRPHPRRLLQARARRDRKGNADQPPHRPPDPPALPRRASTTRSSCIAQVLSYDGENEPDILAMIAASAALTLSGVPFMGPIGAARVGFKDGEYHPQPDPERRSPKASSTSSSPAPATR